MDHIDLLDSDELKVALLVQQLYKNSSQLHTITVYKLYLIGAKSHLQLWYHIFPLASVGVDELKEAF